uniref:F-box/kelch-repeat protein At3g06240-like n=1 Tax=Cicer arietinum TaxID=3827 RepID=A0A1S3EIL9_CICAR|nr:F-box/kelch-repeat protein At3g06240-like [Cicer arietinum]
MEKYASVTKEKVKNYICDDLAFCILSKLPLKSLKRFECVRKSWVFLFENHKFLSIFQNNFISDDHSYYDDTSLLLQLTDKDLCSFSRDNFEDVVKLDLLNPFQDEDPSLWVLDSGSITGILCLYHSDKRFLSDRRFVLWNPTTEEFKIIPQSPLNPVPYYVRDHVFPLGFGYDHVKNDYKLITGACFFYEEVQYYDGSPDYICYPEFVCDYEIYSLRSNSWRDIDEDASFIPLHSGVASQRLHVNGMCHWWHFKGVLDGRDLASFDLVTEKIITTPIPVGTLQGVDDDFKADDIPISLMVLNGSIALISWFLDNTTFNISILGEIGKKESWTKLFTIGPLSDIRLPIGAGKKGDLFFQKKDGKIVWFNLSTQLIEELDIKGNAFSILIYKKSFQSLI